MNFTVALRQCVGMQPCGQPHGQLDGPKLSGPQLGRGGTDGHNLVHGRKSETKKRPATPQASWPNRQLVFDCLFRLPASLHRLTVLHLLPSIPWRRLTSSAPHRPPIAPRTHAPLLPVAAPTGPHHREDSSPAARRSAPMDRWPCSGLPVPGRPHR